MPRKNSIKTLYIDKNSPTGLSYYDSNDDILNLYRDDSKMKRSSTNETLVDKDLLNSRKTLFNPQSSSNFFSMLKRKSETKNKKYTCSDLEKLIDDYTNITGNDIKRKEIYDKIVNAWKDIEKDISCLKNKRNMPKVLTDFFGMTTSSPLQRSNTISSIKRTLTRGPKKTNTSENTLKSRFGSISRKYTK